MTDAHDAPPPVLFAVADGVATVTLNRPDAMNSLDNATKDSLLSTLRQVADDPTIRVLVLTGSGRAFCVGQDLKEHIAAQQSGEVSLGDMVAEHYNPIGLLLATMDKPVVAAVNGVAAGAGASLALAADFRIMVEEGGLNLAFAAIALSCDTGSSWTLPRLVGIAKAKELLLLPRTVSAQDCLALGLVTQVVPAAQFPAAVADLAAKLAAGPTLAYGAIRNAIAFSAGHGFEESIENERLLMAATGRTADHTAAVEAFLSKTRPVYQGR